jgi:hypothetical protein
MAAGFIVSVRFEGEFISKIKKRRKLNSFAPKSGHCLGLLKDRLLNLKVNFEQQKKFKHKPAATMATDRT